MTILITGATGHIGKAIAKTFASNGRSIILNGRNERKLQEIKMITSNISYLCNENRNIHNNNNNIFNSISSNTFITNLQNEEDKITYHTRFNYRNNILINKRYQHVRKYSHDHNNDTINDKKKDNNNNIKQTIWTIPNILTLSRISCTPLLCAFIYNGQYNYAFIGLGIAGFSDWLDGFLARHLNQQTVFGSLIDPVADKILITSLAATEAYCGLLPTYLVGLILFRDFGLVLGGFWYRYKTKPDGVKFFDTTHEGVIKVEPSILSKMNTVGQIALLTFAITNAGYGTPSLFYIDTLIWIVGFTTLGSGIDYLRMNSLVLAPKSERK